MDIFQKAAINKYLYPTAKGSVNTEDLFDLPLTAANAVSLNSVAVAISQQIAAAGVENFVDDKTPACTELNTKLEIVKQVIAYKKAKVESAANRAAKAEQREKARAEIARRQDGKLTELTDAELAEMAK